MTAAGRAIAGCRRPLRRTLARAFARAFAGALCLSVAPADATDISVSALLFASLDAGPSSFLTTGAKITIDGTGRDGVALLASGGGGVRTERGATIRGISTALTRRTAMGAVVVGYQWFHDWGVVSAFAGPEGSVEVETGVEGTTVRPFRFGVRLHGEVWARPTDDSLLTASAILGSTRQSAWGRLAWGQDLWGAFIGPEIGVYVDGTGYSRLGIGIHATDFRIGDTSFRASLGYQTETDGGGSPYVAVGLWRAW